MQWFLIVVIYLVRVLEIKCLESMRCNFNSMCTCTYETGRSVQRLNDISCVAVLFFKYPNVPETSTISHMEVQGTNIISLEYFSLAGIQMQSLTVANNRLKMIADKSFSSTTKVLTSLDLSYNELESIPFNALKELRNLEWLNLHGNTIHSMVGDWSNLQNTVANLFLGENDIADLPLTNSGDSDNTAAHTSSLRHFRVLIWLNLDSNRLTRIHRHSLPVGLQTLSLSHNLLETFPLEVLMSFVHLQWLYLRGNYISFLPEHCHFERRLRLEKIDLSDNALRTLPRNLFNHSVYVRDLNLAFNNLKVLVADTFLGLKCGRIIIAYNQLESLDPKAFNGLQNSLEYLDLDHNNLAHVPHALHHLNQLKYLYLSSNHLHQVPDHSFQTICPNLKGLSLSGNSLVSIPRRALTNCTNISYFNLGYNEIYELFDTDFEWAPNVQTLLLRNNRLTHLKQQIFSKLKSLKELSLSFNPLRHIDTNTFQSLPQLDTLEISFGYEQNNFPHEILKPLTNLQWLTLDNNNFETLTDQSFQALPHLRYLNVENNHLEEIPLGLFLKGANLQDIRFTNNNLGIIKANTFQNLNELQTLLLLGNKITTLERHCFHNLTNLTTLILAHNLINKVVAETFSNLPRLARIDLQGNQLKELSFRVFANVSMVTPLHLNLSHNVITICDSDPKIVNVEVFDLQHNSLAETPRCLENVSALRKLYLDHNIITVLGHNTFMHLTSLEVLTITFNKIHIIHRHSFFGLQNLQILDLSNNYVSQLHANQFASMPRLRILDLHRNRFKYLPKVIFSGTMLEMIDLSNNFLNVIPSLCLADIGTTLRHFLISANNLEHIDSTTFSDIPFLQHLDLSNNKLSILPDNVLTSLGFLQTLVMDSNSLRANFKELFHYAQSLKELHLTHAGIKVMPHLPLPQLVHLNLSFNNIQNISKASIQELSRLRALYLQHNKLSAIPSHMWMYMPLLKTLDLSHNPIKEIVSDSFHGLYNLQQLYLNDLKHLEKLESIAITQLKLSSLTIQTWPKVENLKAQFCLLLANLTKLKKLKVHFTGTSIDDQFACFSSRKLKELEMTGANVKHIDKDAFAKLTKNTELTVRIVGTQIEELPTGLFANFNKMSHFTVDLRNNFLTYLSPDIFYANASTWKNVGTMLISGGLSVAGNPWKCGCHLTWLSHWLRRWARESVQAHAAPVDTVLRVQQLLREATCTHLPTAATLPIVQLTTEDTTCHASALSRARPRPFVSIQSLCPLYLFIYLPYYRIRAFDLDTRYT